MMQQVNDWLDNLEPDHKRNIGLICVNLFIGLVGLFFYPIEAVLYVMLYPWILYFLSYTGAIPFAGFLVYYWITATVIIDMVWKGMWGLPANLYTFAIFIVYGIYAVLHTLRSTSAISSFGAETTETT